MPRISEEAINAVREKADIVDVIGRYLQIHKKGKSYMALCPFHDDHSPSMTISPEKQIYKCFVCGEGGNVFSFVQNYEKVSFVEADGRVASIIGYPLNIDNGPTKSVDPKKEKLYKVLQETINYTMYELNAQNAHTELTYLEKRGINAKLREKFQIGFNPSQDKLLHFLKAKGYEEKDMVDCNVIRMSESGLHDVFSSRITFPIHDYDGNPIGFSARTLDPNNQSKYVNTTETPIFEKGKLLYNAHRAKEVARREGKVYITEGVTDVIAFAKAGIDNCVCTLGTACTKEQLRLLKNMALKLVFCYDGDQAGQNATYKASKLARSLGCDVSIIKNQTGLDPDEIFHKEGEEGIKRLLKDEKTYIEFVMEFLKNQTNFDNYEEKKEYAKKVQAEINSLDDEMDRQYYTNELNTLTGFHLDYRKMQTPIKQDKLTTLHKPLDGSSEAEEQILTMMLAYPEAVKYFKDELGYLNQPCHQELAMMIIDATKHGEEIEIAKLIETTKNEQIRKLITKLVTSWIYQLPYEESAMKGAIRKVNIDAKRKQADAYEAQLSQPLNDESRNLILDEYKKCLVELRRYLDEE
ncbi:MAG: DNA primase [Solobacterium sp.]|nr:DNA primase [Solobacterium sp.]